MPRRLRYNAGFQKKRARVLAPRPTSKEISDRRIMAFIASDPRRQQQNECADPVSVARATAALLREEDQCSTGSRPHSGANKGLPRIARQKRPPYPGVARLGSAGFHRPPAGRQITAPVWAVGGQSGSTLTRRDSEKISLPSLAGKQSEPEPCDFVPGGHFPAIADTMAKHKLRISHPDTKPPLRRKVSGLQATLPGFSSPQVSTNPLGKLRRVPRPRAARTQEEAACDQPPNDWYDMVCRDSLEQWSYCRRKICPRHVRLLPLAEIHVPEVLPDVDAAEDSVIKEPPSPLANVQSDSGQAPWWTQLFRIESNDSPNFSWLFFADAASAMAVSLGQEFGARGSNSLARLYLDWVFCRLSLRTAEKRVDMDRRPLRKPSRWSAGANPSKLRGRRPRSNPLRYRAIRPRSLLHSSECAIASPPSTAPARHLDIGSPLGGTPLLL